MGNIGTAELIIGLIVILVLFGAKRLPEAARGLGQSLRVFKNEMERTAPEVDGDDTAAKLVTGTVHPPATEPKQP